jgi:hypothetical protein
VAATYFGVPTVGDVGAEYLQPALGHLPAHEMPNPDTSLGRAIFPHLTALRRFVPGFCCQSSRNPEQAFQPGSHTGHYGTGLRCRPGSGGHPLTSRACDTPENRLILKRLHNGMIMELRPSGFGPVG